MESNGSIVSVSKAYFGRMHDSRIRKTEKPIPKNSTKYVDLGYQELQKRTDNVLIPYKRKPRKKLETYQKLYNRKLAAFRIKIEHKFRQIKIFKIMRDTYRNFTKKHNLRFNIIAGIVNLKHGF